MQQKQNKSESASKKTSSFSKMMLQRDKNRLKEQQKHAYIELLKAPRGKKYLRLLAKTTELCQQLADIDEEIKQLELELEQEAETLPASDAFVDADGETSEWIEWTSLKEGTEEIEPPKASKPEIKVRWNQPISANTSSAVEQGNEPQRQFAWNTPITTHEVQTAQTEQAVQESQRAQVAWKNAKTDAKAVIKSYQEKQQRLYEMKQRQVAMAEEFRTAMEEFKEQLPAPDKCIGLIYPSWNAKILMRYGVIACPGNSYATPEEMLEQVQPRSEQEERQWLKGDEVYREHFCDELLLVEIYMDAVCVVYKDGNTKVIE